MNGEKLLSSAIQPNKYRNNTLRNIESRINKKYTVLFVSGCPNTRKIIKSVVRELERLLPNEVAYEVLDTQNMYEEIAPLLRAPGNKITAFLRIINRLIGNQRVWLAKYIVEMNRPDIVVVGDDGGINATFIKVAKLKGIPTLAIQVGILSEAKVKDITYVLKWKNYFFWRILSRMASNPILAKFTLLMGWRTIALDWGLSQPRKIAVMGEHYKYLLIGRGVSNERIVVTGYVLIDELYEYLSSSGDKRSKLAEKMDFDPKKKIITLISQPYVEDHYCTTVQFMKIVTKIISSINENFHLIIKLHPREKIEKYRQLLIKFGYSNVSLVESDNVSLPELILSSDVVLTFSSTAGLFALAFHEPLIILDVFEPLYKNILKRYAITVQKIDELNKILKSVSEKTEEEQKLRYDNFIREQLYKLDGKASLRVAKVIVNMLQQSRDKPQMQI